MFGLPVQGKSAEKPLANGEAMGYERSERLDPQGGLGRRKQM
jgi:hypothetical protein